MLTHCTYSHSFPSRNKENNISHSRQILKMYPGKLQSKKSTFSQFVFPWSAFSFFECPYLSKVCVCECVFTSTRDHTYHEPIKQSALNPSSANYRRKTAE